jgi:hypothetical protein
MFFQLLCHFHQPTSVMANCSTPSISLCMLVIALVLLSILLSSQARGFDGTQPHFYSQPKACSNTTAPPPSLPPLGNRGRGSAPSGVSEEDAAHRVLGLGGQVCRLVSKRSLLVSFQPLPLSGYFSCQCETRLPPVQTRRCPRSCPRILSCCIRHSCSLFFVCLFFFILLALHS